MPFFDPHRYPSDIQLIQVANGVISSYEALADMVESIEHFVNRLSIYTETSHSMPTVDEIVVKLMVELISTLSLVTRKLKKRRLRESSRKPHALPYSGAAVKWIKNFFGVKDINAARQKLERLLREEERAVGAQILGLVDSKRISCAGHPPFIEYPSTPRQQSNPQYV